MIDDMLADNYVLVPVMIIFTSDNIEYIHGSYIVGYIDKSIHIT